MITQGMEINVKMIRKSSNKININLVNNLFARILKMLSNGPKFLTKISYFGVLVSDAILLLNWLPKYQSIT